MVIPKVCTWANLQALKDSSEAITVRVILTGRPAATKALIKTRRRTYSFEWSNTLKMHVLDVPLTVWAYDINGTANSADVTATRISALGVPCGTYKIRNRSICADLNRIPNMELVITAVPYTASRP